MYYRDILFPFFQTLHNYFINPIAIPFTSKSDGVRIAYPKFLVPFNNRLPIIDTPTASLIIYTQDIRRRAILALLSLHQHHWNSSIWEYKRRICNSLLQMRLSDVSLLSQTIRRR